MDTIHHRLVGRRRFLFGQRLKHGDAHLGLRIRQQRKDRLGFSQGIMLGRECADIGIGIAQCRNEKGVQGRPHKQGIERRKAD